MNECPETKLLRSELTRMARHEQLNNKHIAPLTKFVDELRIKHSDGKEIPYFDPLDGGVEAEVLYLLEAPGKKACNSGFISRDNNDETAKNFLLLNCKADIPRERTICWNAVPWYIGSGNKIRPAKRSDINDGLQSLHELLNLLPKLKAVVLIGSKAQQVKDKLEEKLRCVSPKTKIFLSPHPSPMYINRSQDNRQKILDVLCEVNKFLNCPQD